MAENEMCFPETWEEFKKQYRIVDTEKVYTNGIEMIPTFRVEQWLEHCKNIKCSQQENKMAKVAELFGKKLGERFCIIRYGDRYDARFLERGFEVYGLENPYVDVDSFVLADLLAGRAEIVEDEE
jgi:uncharacterized metal-binding protein